MVESMEQLPGLLTTSKCRIDVPGLRESLSIVAVDIHHTLLRLNDVSTSKGMLRGLGVKLKAWKSRDELMANIKRIDDELTACFSFITDLTDAEPDFEEATEHGIPATEDQDLSRDQEPLNDRELFLETLRPCLARLKDVFEGHIRDMDADPQQLYTLFEIRGMSLAELSNAIHTVSTIMTKLPKPSFAHKYISRLVEMLETATSHMPPGSSFVQTDRDRLSNAVYLAKILQTLDALGTELDSSTPGGRSPSTMTVETILACIDKLTTDLMHANLISNAHDIISHFIPVLDRMIKNRLHHPAQWPLVGTFLAFLVYLPTCLYRLGYVAEGHTRSLEATSVCIHLAGKYPAAVQLLVVQNLVCTAQDLRTFGFKSSAMLTLEKAMSFMQSVVETPHGLANYSAQILLNASELWLSMKDYKLALKAAKEAVNIRTHLLHAPLDRQETRAHLPCSEFAHEHVFSRATAASTGTHPPLALSPILAIAESWTSVARCCQAMGQPQKALEALNEAVQLQKREEPSLPVAEAQLSGQRSNEGTKHLGEWARLLDEWTGMLSVLGSSTAYDTGQASISIHRRLADENPGTLSTELAHSLVTFWDAYQPPSPASDGAYAHQDNDITGQSTVAIQEAVRIYRAFLHVRPEVHGQQLLAGALTREALSLRQTSPSDSLSIALEAADIWMSINGVDNLGYLDPSFIRTVKLLLVLLAYFRRPEECAALATVAHPLIDTYAAQAEDTPDKYYPELASLLIIVATQLSYLGRYDECAITAQRAATIFTSLHEKGLETKDPALARWQMLLSECLYDRGHLEDSLMWAQKGIRSARYGL
ncbi:hypothetical protein PLICRDRAFT_239241 [Plicaturopsis crispa FD-325 SS-3]|nr:hypothetical protein PLICRDRAFT_239241 [Plicaturopsis crispa FD-325 SS-3]